MTETSSAVWVKKLAHTKMFAGMILDHPDCNNRYYQSKTELMQPGSPPSYASLAHFALRDTACRGMECLLLLLKVGVIPSSDSLAQGLLDVHEPTPSQAGCFPAHHRCSFAGTQPHPSAQGFKVEDPSNF